MVSSGVWPGVWVVLYVCVMCTGHSVVASIRTATCDGREEMGDRG